MSGGIDKVTCGALVAVAFLSGYDAPRDAEPVLAAASFAFGTMAVLWGLERLVEQWRERRRKLPEGVTLQGTAGIAKVQTFGACYYVTKAARDSSAIDLDDLLADRFADRFHVDRSTVHVEWRQLWEARLLYPISVEHAPEHLGPNDWTVVLSGRRLMAA